MKTSKTVFHYYNDGEALSPWRESLNTVVFGSETPMGRAFDIGLSISIVLSLIVIMLGSLVYSVESREAGFASIPVSVYWAVVTLTTVGYGDISPQTPLGRLLASAIMIMGYGIIAVPTGIYSAELIRTYTAGKVRNDACPDCERTGHDFDADYCKYCGHALED